MIVCEFKKQAMKKKKKNNLIFLSLQILQCLNVIYTCTRKFKLIEEFLYLIQKNIGFISILVMLTILWSMSDSTVFIQ